MKLRQIVAMILTVVFIFALAGCNLGKSDTPETTLTATNEANNGRDTQNLLSGIKKNDRTAK